ncbi:PAS domain S-box-containing protein [Granulicella pectinivorans]|jgi:PAS domain S-box-containing protein|uniref:histidine kinase n=1 Tax=Granulicella pectinivorans TaxID=474950 RepID=A0A1I6L0V3_9BACT|nr:ATP-binding protein [Granulicella pectinivorans]SFR97072.1 PAS domain S-box-containing protein [Granulicella pectinivorans]
MWAKIFKSRRPAYVVMEAVALMIVIAIVDLNIHAQVPLALVYLVPAAYAGTGLSRWQIPAFGALCTAIAEMADAFPWSVAQGIPRDALYFIAYTAAGLYVSEVLANRRREEEHLHEVELEGEARQQAEEQLRLLVTTSSIAIVTSDEQGRILQANDAAERLFGGGEKPLKLTGQGIAELIPALARAPSMGRGQRQLKTMMQCQGLRADLEPFFADVWFSTYRTAEGNRLTAMIVDSSKEIRDREEANLEQVLTGLRLLVGSVSHEIRNICAAIGFVQQKLATQRPDLVAQEDFKALQQLTTTLERLAAVELSQVKHQAGHVHLNRFLQDLRIIVGPSLREAGVSVDWDKGEDTAMVWADPQGLLQVFLNLIRNAEAALADRDDARLTLSVRKTKGFVQIRVADNGSGIADPDHLFNPFRTAKRKPGQLSMGLYLSRALVTSFHGDLRYEPNPAGAVFVVELLPVETVNESDAECCR